MISTIITIVVDVADDEDEATSGYLRNCER
jgi:hypothetical protein